MAAQYERRGKAIASLVVENAVPLLHEQDAGSLQTVRTTVPRKRQSGLPNAAQSALIALVCILLFLLGLLLLGMW